MRSRGDEEIKAPRSLSPPLPCPHFWHCLPCMIQSRPIFGAHIALLFFCKRVNPHHTLVPRRAWNEDRDALRPL